VHHLAKRVQNVHNYWKLAASAAFLLRAAPPPEQRCKFWCRLAKWISVHSDTCACPIAFLLSQYDVCSVPSLLDNDTTAGLAPWLRIRWGAC